LEAHETQEQIEQAHHRSNKRAAILIASLAALLAIAEMAGKHAQTASIAYNIEASDLWSFYQAKTIRSTMLRTAIDAVELMPAEASSAEARQKRLAAWHGTVERYESDPATKEGRKELAERAKQTEELRDRTLSAYHDFEYGSAAFQLAIVMASAAVITEFGLLELVSLGLGVAGIACGLVGWFAPMLIEL
jgi:hypothetical protein